MAEMRAAGGPPDQVPSERVRTALPMTPAAARPRDGGDAVVDVPPLIEFGEIGDAADQRAPSGPLGHRPVRRRFLAPVLEAVSAAPDAPVLFREPHTGVGTRARQLLPPAEVPPSQPPRGQPSGDSLASPVFSLLRRRHLAVAAGVGVALVLAIGVEIGTRTDWFGRVRAVVAQPFGGSRAPSAGRPPADPARLVAYYTQRATAGDAEAELALAILYAKGSGAEQDYALAAKWFRAAAEKGVARAQYDLGVLCEHGRGVPLDYAAAAAWYGKAAAQDYALAQYNLAVAYTKGEGVRRDLLEAASWYHRAAVHGVVAAMLNLAILYERGDGVGASTVDAYAWYRAAARRGSEAAQRRADELLRAFAPWDQSSAEAKTDTVAASIHDAVAEHARLAASAPPTGAPAPVLKPGIDSEPGSTRDADTGTESPQPGNRPD
jgi:hypothetical protein